MRTSPKGIFFDLGETLVTQNIEDNLVTKRALEEITQTLELSESPARLFRIYKQGYKANHAIRSRHHVEIPVETWMRELLAKALNGKPSVSLVRRAIDIIVECRAANAVAFKGARAILKRLAQERFRLAIISNVSSHDVALEILRKVGLYPYLDGVITSAQTGIRKPDPGIFLYALRKFGLEPNQAVHVGDSEFHDVGGAQPVGITTVLVQDAPQRADTAADYRVRSLAEASNLLFSLQQKT